MIRKQKALYSLRRKFYGGYGGFEKHAHTYDVCAWQKCVRHFGRKLVNVGAFSNSFCSLLLCISEPIRFSRVMVFVSYQCIGRVWPSLAKVGGSFASKTQQSTHWSAPNLVVYVSCELTYHGWINILLLLAKRSACGQIILLLYPIQLLNPHWRLIKLHELDKWE